MWAVDLCVNETVSPKHVRNHRGKPWVCFFCFFKTQVAHFWKSAPRCMVYFPSLKVRVHPKIVGWKIILCFWTWFFWGKITIWIRTCSPLAAENIPFIFMNKLLTFNNLDCRLLMGGGITQGINMLYIDPWEDGPEKWPANFHVCETSNGSFPKQPFHLQHLWPTIPRALKQQDVDGWQWKLAIVDLIDFGIIQPKHSLRVNISDFSDSRHFKQVHSPLFLTSITSILSKRSRTFLGPWVLHHLSWLYKQQAARCVFMRVMGRSVDGMLGCEPHGPLEVEEAIKAQIRRRHQEVMKIQRFFFCQGDFLPSKNPFNF